MTEAVRVLIIADHYAPAFKAGGPVRSLSAIVELPIGVEFCVLTRNRDLGSKQPLEGVPEGVWVRRGAAEILYVNTRSLRSWFRAVKLLRQRRFAVWYLNSLFSPLATLLPLTVRRARLAKPRRVVLAPRGELSLGALQLSRSKKRIALLILAGMRLFDGVVWHATSRTEYEEIRSALGRHARQVHMATQMAPVRPACTTDAEPSREPPGTTRAVFLSRISRKKNLLGGIRALAEAAHPVSLSIYGPVEDEQYWMECQKAMQATPDRHTVRYAGEVTPDQVADVLGRADVFLFPTLGENFGHVIFEALVSGCFVIIGRDTPWTKSVHNHCGTVVNPADATATARALDDFYNLTYKAKQDSRAASLAAAIDWAESARDDGAWLSLLVGDHTGVRDNVRTTEKP